MKSPSKNIRGIPSIRIPVAPPGKAMSTAKDYDRKRQKTDIRNEIEQQESEMGRYA